MPDNRCSNCITWNHDCTYVEAAKVCAHHFTTDQCFVTSRAEKRSTEGVSIPLGEISPLLTAILRYVESLENRLEKMEKLLRSVRIESSNSLPYV
jgi:hypothetical protein